MTIVDDKTTPYVQISCHKIFTPSVGLVYRLCYWGSMLMFQPLILLVSYTLNRVKSCIELTCGSIILFCFLLNSCGKLTFPLSVSSCCAGQCGERLSYHLWTKLVIAERYRLFLIPLFWKWSVIQVEAALPLDSPQWRVINRQHYHLHRL